MSKVLEVKNLNKNYGNFQAVKDVSFDINENEIFALVGPNGAGKSTILKIVSTILSPTSGEVLINGENLQHKADSIRKMISYLPEEAGAYKNFTGLGYLEFMADIYADNARQRKEYLEFAKEISGLEDRLQSKIATYSKGMTRKLLLARTVMSKPKLAILDEPTSGLDIMNGYEIRTVIKNLAKTGMAVL